MYLTYQFRIDKADEPYKMLRRLTHDSKNLYNQTLYTIKSILKNTQKTPSKFDLRDMMREVKTEEGEINYRKLSSGSSYYTVEMAFLAVKAFFIAKRDYEKNPGKYKGSPRFPRFLEKDGLQTVVIDGRDAKIDEDGYIRFGKFSKYIEGEGVIKIPYKEYLKYKRFWKNEEGKSIYKVLRIVPRSKGDFFNIEFIYKRDYIETTLDKDRAISIDIGVNNLMTVCDSSGATPIIINGRPLKSINQYFNKENAKYSSKINKKDIKNSKKKRSLVNKRNSKIQDYMHKSSRYLIDYCLEHSVGKIVIGYNPGWKQEINIGKVNNQSFVGIPFYSLINMIEYKAELHGIEVEQVKESYTSKCSALDLEPISKKEDNNYLGRRIHRGLFRTGEGILINADVNASLNILRNAIGDKFLSKNKKPYLDNPIKVTME